MLGHEDLAIYDGSMFEWCMDPGTAAGVGRGARLTPTSKNRTQSLHARHHPASSIPESLYAEKIRLILGYKDLAWKSVDHSHGGAQTRPDGADRRLPPHAGAADRCGLYCDTALIEVLERIAPTKPLPAGQGRHTLRSGATATCSGPPSPTSTRPTAWPWLCELPPEQVQAYHQDRAELLRTRPLSGFAETKATLCTCSACSRCSKAEPQSGASDIPGIAIGDQIEIMPSDYGLDPVQGELVLVEANHVAVRRTTSAPERWSCISPESAT